MGMRSLSLQRGSSGRLLTTQIRLRQDPWRRPSLRGVAGSGALRSFWTSPSSWRTPAGPRSESPTSPSFGGGPGSCCRSRNQSSGSPRGTCAGPLSGSPLLPRSAPPTSASEARSHTHEARDCARREGVGSMRLARFVDMRNVVALLLGSFCTHSGDLFKLLFATDPVAISVTRAVSATVVAAGGLLKCGPAPHSPSRASGSAVAGGGGRISWSL
mmetsp:Transcript_87059/g.281034  ORF Transcript_87059/g.281034 Transcript_87059/m.281034 type:complete len:215 (-) Transcript_87059:125-769(-)